MSNDQPKQPTPAQPTTPSRPSPTTTVRRGDDFPPLRRIEIPTKKA